MSKLSPVMNQSTQSCTCMVVQKGIQTIVSGNLKCPLHKNIGKYPTTEEKMSDWVSCDHHYNTCEHCKSPSPQGGGYGSSEDEFKLENHALGRYKDERDELEPQGQREMHGPQVSEELEKILDKAFWDVCLKSHTDVANGYSYDHKYGIEETMDKIQKPIATERQRLLESIRAKFVTPYNGFVNDIPIMSHEIASFISILKSSQENQDK